MRRFFKYIRPYKSLVVQAIICQIGVALFTVVSIPAFIPFLRSIFGVSSTEQYDGVLGQIMSQIETWTAGKTQAQALGMICLLLIIIFFFKNVFRYGASFFIAPVRAGILKDIRSDLYSSLLKSEFSILKNVQRGDIMSRLSTDVAEVEWSVMNTLETVFRQPFIVVGCLLFMLMVSPVLTLWVFLLMSALAIILSLINKNLKKASGNVQDIQGQLLAQVDETLDGTRVLRAYNATTTQEKRFQQMNTFFGQHLAHVLRIRDLASPLSEWVGVSVFALLLWIGSRYVFNASMGPETFFAFLIAFFYIIEPAKALAQAQSHISKGAAALDRLDELRRFTLERLNEEGARVDQLEQIVFDQVHHQYNDAQKKLGPWHFTIQKGDHILLKGPSGIGKTSVLDLILGLFTPSDGQIRINNISLTDLNITTWRDRIAYVSQDPILFRASITENITCGNHSVPFEKVKQSSKAAAAHDFISALQDGYDTVIGDRGSTLSGGERQRIALARALASDAEIILLDEITSALDAENTKRIHETIRSQFKTKTVIWISHDTEISFPDFRVIRLG